MLINFTTISISDTKYGNGSCLSPQNYLIFTMQNGKNSKNDKNEGVSPVPASIKSSPIGANKYDYNKYFFVN